MGLLDDGKPHNWGVAEARERVRFDAEREREDFADVALAETVLRDELGTADFEAGKRMLQQHLWSVPADRFDQIVSAARLPAGVDPLADPGVLKALAFQIIGPLPQTREAIETELVTLRKRMSTREWFSDDRAQLRYRILLQARDQAK